MLTRRLARLATAFGFVLAAAVATDAGAQGITTGAITGFVTDASGNALEGVQVSITNRTTGFTQRGLSREGGRYNLTSLEVGGPYTLEARRIGFQPHTRDGIQVQLSQTSRIDIRLEAQATQLSELEIRATTGEIIAPTNTGTKTTVSQQALERSPSTTRNLVDYTRAAPQVSSSGPGFSGGGMSNRMNNVQIDGATERDVFGLGSTGQPGGQISAKAISIDAVKEYQILLAPYDVRQGNFGGLLLNAVTKSGTNELHGSAFKYYRNQDYGRDVATLRATEFNRHQTGFSLGGPIIKDKLHFFTANEWTRESTPVSGPFLGQPADATTAFPFTAAEVTQFENAFTAKGGTVGTAGIVNSPTPMDNIFGRVDWQINDNHRLVARMNYTDATNNNRRQNARNATRAVFSSNFHAINSNKKAPVVQLYSTFGNGWANEAFAGATWVRDRRTSPEGQFPQITVNYSASRTMLAGTDQFSQGNELDADTYEFTDNLTVPRGNHSIVLGTRNELVKIRNLFSQSTYGVWTFADIASFEAGTPNGLRKGIVLGDDPNVYFDALQTALYAQDTWTVNPKLTLTAGIRGDISRFLTDNSYAPAIDSAYGAHTTPTGAIQFSPRLGFNLDVTGDQMNQVRGGIGLFVGTPPYVWLENAYAQNGNIITFLQCGSGFGNAANPAPAFNADITKVPNVCANGQGTKPIGDVSFLDKDIKFPQPMRANLAYDRVLPFNLVATVEGLYSKTLNQLFFVNRNLTTPRATDKFGRTLYGVVGTGGTATTDRPPLVTANGGTARFSTAIDVENQNKDYAYNLTAQLRKRYSNGWEALVAYNYGHAYDVQSFTSSTHISNWSFGRTLFTAQDNIQTTTSLFDQPHKISAFVTKTFNWGRFIKNSWADGLGTDITVAYAGVSGAPHDYVYGGSSGRGDMNADGIVGNDLIYVPTDVNDVNQIRFATFTAAGETLAAADQAAAFEKLIAGNECLNSKRGQIMERNSCRLPFSNNWDVTVRQNIPLVSSDQRVAIQLDLFNFANLLNKKWGQAKFNPISTFNNISLLTHTASSSADPAAAVPTVNFNYRLFDPNKTGDMTEYQVGNIVGNYWRMQLSARVSF
jgi:outer membrane receptor for ferrienterochelin and colicin